MTGAPAPKARRILALRIVVSVALLAIVLSQISFGQLLHTFQRFSAGMVLLVLAIDLVGGVVGAFKWRAILPAVHVRSLFAIGMIGRFYSFVLPGQVFGEVAKGYRLTQLGENVTVGEAAVSVFIDKVTGLLAVLLWGAVGIVIAGRRDLWLLGLLFFGAAVAGFISLVMSRRVSRVIGAIRARLDTREPGRGRRWVTSALDVGERELAAVPRAPAILASIAFGCLFIGIGVTTLTLIARDIGVNVGFWDFAWVHTVVSVAALIPLAIAGLGIREVSFVTALGLIGGAREEAMAVSVGFLGLQVFDALIGWIMEITHRPARVTGPAAKSD
jgi:uncharacterized membrane protein YbhN (UPF0104 family)